MLLMNGEKKTNFINNRSSENKNFAGNIEVLRQTGEKNWQLYSRWYHMSVGGYGNLL